VIEKQALEMIRFDILKLFFVNGQLQTVKKKAFLYE